MAGEVNWKAKYTELKAKYMDSVEMAFRLGFEQGGQQAQQDQAMQQQQQEQELNAAALQGANSPGGIEGGQPGAGGPESGDFADQQGPGATQPAGPGKGIEPMEESEHPDGSELDQHIATLEGMLSKSETSPEDFKRVLHDLKNLQANRKQQIELKKSALAIPAIAKALHKPKFKIGAQASHNMNGSAKAAVTMQHRIVDDIMQKWEKAEKNASRDILSQLGIEGLTKKEE